MMNRLGSTGLLAFSLAACSPSAPVEMTTAPTPLMETQVTETLTPTSALNYRDSANWLCRPGLENSYCDTDQNTSIVAVDGTITLEPFTPASDPAIDCFYVYPTVSRDLTDNSDTTPGPGESSIIAQQAARLGQSCRVFAPLYRQRTLTALFKRAQGIQAGDEELAYNDVLASWHDYLAHDNNGRGVVLIGHSQGSGILADMYPQDIMGTPGAAQIISLIPTGTNVKVDLDTGLLGDMPACESASQLGCYIGFVSFRVDSPPPETTGFGVSNEEGKRAACVNPAMLSGDNGALNAYLTTANAMGGPQPVFVEGTEITTPFASVPGLLTAECKTSGAHTYLSITTHGDPTDPRTDTIRGDVVLAGEVQADWGLHLIDMHLTMGNLLSVIDTQSEAWQAAQAE